MAFSTWHLNTVSKSGGMKYSLTPLKLLLHLNGRRFLGAGGHGNFFGILASFAVGVVEQASSSSSSLSFSLGFVFIGFNDRKEIPEITHFFVSDSSPDSMCDFLENLILNPNRAEKTSEKLGRTKEEKTWPLIK